MGIAKDVIDLMDTALEILDMSYKEVLICELGDQKMKFGKHRIAKKYFESLGARHVSIDINGKNGAKKLDLAKPIKKWKNTFDIVTNYGTSEHVEGQDACFENIHNFCRVGGAMVHVVPLKGTYKRHSPYHYDTEFFNILAAMNHYTVILNAIRRRSDIAANVCVVLIKERDNEYKTFC